MGNKQAQGPSKKSDENLSDDDEENLTRQLERQSYLENFTDTLTSDCKEHLSRIYTEYQEVSGILSDPLTFEYKEYLSRKYKEGQGSLKKSTESSKSSSIKDYSVMDVHNPADEEIFMIEASVNVRTHVTLKELPGDYSKNVETLFSQKEPYEYVYSLLVFPNGFNKNHKGYVSISLNISQIYTFFEGVCIVSLIDSSNRKRLPRTFDISYETTSPILIEKYISTEMLFNDPDELLPGCVLALSVDLWLKPGPLRTNISVNIYFQHESSLHGQVNGLYLDSPLSKRLAEESIYFRAIVDTSMVEMKTKLMPLSNMEMEGFYYIAKLAMGDKFLEFSSVYQILQMHVLADKYHIPFVSETSTCFMKLYASVNGVDDFRKRITEFEAQYLVDLLMEKITLVRNTRFSEEISDNGSTHVYTKRPVCGISWLYIYTCKAPLTFKRMKHKNKTEINQCKLENHETVDFDFNK